MIILASQSPRRQELMKLTGLPFTVRVADIDETMDDSLPPVQEVGRVSRLKAQAIAAAALRLAAKAVSGEVPVAGLTPELFEAELNPNGLPDFDLIIRTSGEYRLSNFFPFESAYAELVFTPVYWPDFDEREYLKAIAEFQTRSRRFGGVAPA